MDSQPRVWWWHQAGTADTAVTWPDNPPLGGGDGVWLFCALWAHREHTPVIRGACGQRLPSVELPCCQIGDRNQRFQHRLKGKQRNHYLLDFSVLTLEKGAVRNISHCRISASHWIRRTISFQNLTLWRYCSTIIHVLIFVNWNESDRILNLA